jgi:hypothetical protein
LIRPLDRAQTFTEVVFLRVPPEWLLGDEDVWSVELEHRLKRAIPFYPTVDRAQTLTEAVFVRVAMELLHGDEDVCSVELDYWIKRAIPFHPTVRSRSNFYRGCFPWRSYGMATR